MNAQWPELQAARSPRPQGCRKFALSKAQVVAGPGREDTPRPLQRTRDQARDALQVRQTAGRVARAGREGPRHLNRSAASSTPAKHVFDLSVGFRPLPQTTRGSSTPADRHKRSCRPRRPSSGCAPTRWSMPNAGSKPASPSGFVWFRQFEPGNNSADANRLLDRLEHLQTVEELLRRPMRFRLQSLDDTGPRRLERILPSTPVSRRSLARLVRRSHLASTPSQRQAPQKAVEVGIALRHRMNRRARSQCGQMMLNRTDLVQQPERIQGPGQRPQTVLHRGGNRVRGEQPRTRRLRRVVALCGRGTPVNEDPPTKKSRLPSPTRASLLLG